MTTDPNEPRDGGLEESGLGPADHGGPAHTHPVEREGYEGEGLGPRDHAADVDPDVPRDEREGYEGEGLGPHDHQLSDEELED